MNTQHIKFKETKTFLNFIYMDSSNFLSLKIISFSFYTNVKEFSRTERNKISPQMLLNIRISGLQKNTSRQTFSRKKFFCC